MGVTQPAKFGEEWSDERISGWLNLLPPEGENADHHLLQRAYQSMRAYDFERFIQFFLDAGKDINAPDAQGRTFLSVICRHTPSTDFIRIIEDAGGVR